ncbi:MAG: hypothetical protein IIT49_04070, partial [Clostridia bacterium]|nr:hypothetical protein [Clostridia bacterium]
NIPTNIPKWEYCKSIGFKPFSSIFPFKFIFKGILGKIGKNGKLKMENYLKATTSHITLTAQSRFSVLLCMTV